MIHIPCTCCLPTEIGLSERLRTRGVKMIYLSRDLASLPMDIFKASFVQWYRWTFSFLFIIFYEKKKCFFFPNFSIFFFLLLGLVPTSDVTGIANILRSSKSGIGRNRKPPDSSDSDLHCKAPYTSDPDSPSDCVASGKQPLRTEAVKFRQT